MNRKAEPFIKPVDRPSAPDALRTPVFQMDYATWHAHLAGSRRLIVLTGSARSPMRGSDSPITYARSTDIDDAA